MSGLINNDDCIVIAIDFQDKLVNMLSDKTPAIKMSKLVQAAKLLSIPVIITEQYPKGLGPTISEIGLQDNCVVTEKTSFSALAEAKFKNILHASQRKTVLIAGIETHICVYQTVVELLENGYEVYVIEDACASRNTYENNTGIRAMENKGAKIICLEIALFELLKTSKHPNFKEVQALIK